MWRLQASARTSADAGCLLSASGPCARRAHGSPAHLPPDGANQRLTAVLGHAAGVSKYAEAGACPGPEGFLAVLPDQIVFPVAEKREIVVFHPLDQRAAFGDRLRVQGRRVAFEIVGDFPGPGAHPSPVLHGGAHVEVREQPGVLEYIGDRAAPGWQVVAIAQPGGVAKADDAAGLRVTQPGNTIQQGALAAAAGAEDGGNAAVGQLAIQLQVEPVFAAAGQLQPQAVHARTRQPL